MRVGAEIPKPPQSPTRMLETTTTYDREYTSRAAGKERELLYWHWSATTKTQRHKGNAQIKVLLTRVSFVSLCLCGCHQTLQFEMKSLTRDTRIARSACRRARFRSRRIFGCRPVCCRSCR